MTLGNAVDARNMDINLKEGDLLGDVVIIAEVIRASGQPALVVVSDENMNWLKEDGMISRALDKIRYDTSVDSAF